ncbi:metallophosphoesterase family protein [Cohnella faecalis]|uniref:Metallophosphoesterase n=1 Tax=Cohnella faecalis TaxID=2315694 RepID=A0A398CMS2_9BACL|nr:metallophosphoesterase family protein [Cohnella faecalis]RIE03540.1 metallophosphoesterase [Cohnella faecalis]
MSRLRFNEDGTFKIVQFTDIHWQNGEPADWRSLALMKEIAANEKPDLVVFTGDVIHSELTADPKAAFADAVSVVTGEGGVPWAFVFGNHDAEEGVSRNELMELARKLPGCMAEQGPVDVHGVGNYRLSVHRSAAPEEVGASLYLFDSGSYAPQEIGGSAWIHRSQIDWYVRESSRLKAGNRGNVVRSLAFFHIPLPEFNEVWDFRACCGHNFEGVGCPKINSGLFHAFWERGDVKGVFVGHDHVNDYWGTLHGIRLCYGKATGYNGYGSEGLPRGARIIRLHEDERPFDTWLRLDNGQVVYEQPVHIPAIQDLILQSNKRLRS